MSNNTGGPAFAQQLESNRDGFAISGGMTLRDYFAARAMQGIVSKEASHVSWVDDYAKNAYKMADAMLKAREA